MRNFIYVLALIIISCNNQQQKVRNSDNLNSAPTVAPTNQNNKSNKEISWTGTLNGKTPIFIHYQLDSNVIVGEIIYLNTKNQLPIKLLGTVEEKNRYRLLEFDKTGNITGVIEGTPTGQEFRGSWFSPKTRKELDMRLHSKDTVINSSSINPDATRIFGDYHYQYSENGYNGDFEFQPAGKGKAAFQILALTEIERGPNIAEVEKDTIAFTGNHFIYKIPGSDSCEFKVKFYKGFVYVNYTKGYCEGQFGMNATIDGIFLKTK